MTSNPPLPSEHKSWPAVFYPGVAEDTTSAAEQGRPFARHQDVPEGWVHSLGHVKQPPKDREAPPALAPKMDRPTLKALLDELGEVYAPNASLAALQRQYDDAMAIISAGESKDA